MPEETTPPEFKFKVETLQTDLGEQLVPEKVLTVGQKQAQTEEINLPAETSSSSSPADQEKKPIIEQVILPSVEPIELTPEKPEYLFQSAATDSDQTSLPANKPILVPAQPSKIRQLGRIARRVKPAYLALSIVIILLIFGFFFIKAKLAQKRSKLITPETATSPVAIFVPPGAAPPAPTAAPTTSTQLPTQSIQTQPTLGSPGPISNDRPPIPTATKSTIVIQVNPDIGVIVTTTATSAKIVLPSRQTTVTPVNQSKRPTTEEPSSPKITTKIEGSQREISPAQTNDRSWIFDLAAVEVELKDLTTENLKAAGTALLPIQKKAGALWLINLKYNNQKVPVSLLLDYFIRPKFIEQKFTDRFKQSLGPKFELIYYFSHTRKFPILVFEVADELTAVPFMRLWDKETLIDDMSKFYLGLSKGKFIRKYFVTKSLTDVDYRIAYKDDDYKLIWLMYNNKLIISGSLSGLQILLTHLQSAE